MPLAARLSTVIVNGSVNAGQQPDHMLAFPLTITTTLLDVGSKSYDRPEAWGRITLMNREGDLIYTIQIGNGGSQQPR